MSGTISTKCPECDGELRDEPNETVCATCGLIVAEDWLDRGPEWRPFDTPDSKRAGAPLTRSRHDLGLSTEIGHGGRRLTGRKRRRLARLRREHNRARIGSKADRNQVYAFTEIRRVTSALSLPNRTRDHACMLFESAQKEDLLRGRSVEGFAAAALYAACRADGIARTVDEIAEASRGTAEELKAAYDAMNRDLGLPTGPIDPREYIPRYASELDLPASVERRAMEFVDELMERDAINGRNPSGVAAGCLYTAASERNYPLTQKQAADVAGVTEVTLRSTFSTLTQTH